MVRAHVKQTPEEKQDTHKKKTSAKKKSVETGSWPCKINGCNKVFAREADLKRHQRTTKLHSLPGFACPQCDATFTRTDALRRHQKSRHNGVVIEPTEQDKPRQTGDPGSPSSRSGSREGTPSPSQDERAGSSKSSPNGPPRQPSTAGPSNGSSNYYRQHTMTSYPPHPPPGMVIDPHYPPIAIPTSAARLHQAAWPPPWGINGAAIPSNAVYHIPTPGYYSAPSPYYRPMHAPPHLPQYLPDPGPHRPPTDDESTRPSKKPKSKKADPPSDKKDEKDAVDGSATEENPQAPAASAIDPSLDKPSAAPAPAPKDETRENAPQEDIESNGVAAVSAAVQALLTTYTNSLPAAETASRGSSAAAVSEQLHAASSLHIPAEPENATSNSAQSSAPANPEPGVTPVDADAEGKADVDTAGEANRKGEVKPAAQRDEQLSTTFTEEGEPILNASELLTQESLASPPP